MGFSRPTGNNTGTTEYDKLGKGKFKARLIAVANLGTFQDEYKGETKNPAPKMALQLEIIGNPVKIGDDMKPRQMWTRPFNYFSTLTERGNELKFYKGFDEFAKDKDIPDWESVMDKAVYVLVEPQGAEDYDNIVSLAAMDEEVAENVGGSESELIIDNVEGNERLEARLFGLAKYQYEQPHYEEGEPEPTQEPTDDYEPY